VTAVPVVAQQESKPEGFAHPAELKVKDWADEREMSKCETKSKIEIFEYGFR
jgi:hypothetical protein